MNGAVATACQNKSGNTPLYLACREGHLDTLKYLVSEPVQHFMSEQMG